MPSFPPFRCPLCKSNGYTHVGKSKGGQVIHCCAGCSVMFTDPEAFTRQNPHIGVPFSPDFVYRDVMKKNVGD